MTTLAILGYGRFGAAFASLAREAGLAVRAHDPVAAVPDGERAGSPAELCEGADCLMIAVPLGEMRSAIESVAPALAPETVVFDVGSVKSLPAGALDAILGARRPWVATHPLFGPTSLARGERPLRAVVCPNPRHPAAVERVGALYRALGCEVVAQSAEAHDRAMAFTHALAFFVAKGMLDAGVPLDAPAVPPSFRAIEAMIDSVRADAGHLFSALHRDNPFAGEARRALLAALASIDRDLERPASDGAATRALAIPDLGARSPALRETRELIDELDRELVALLGRRAQLSRRAAEAKAAIGAGVLDPAREARLLAERRRWAEASGLPPAALDEIFLAILCFSRRLQEPAP